MIKKSTTTKSIALLILLTSVTVAYSEETPELDSTDSPQQRPPTLVAEDVVITVEGEDITHGAIMQATRMQITQMSHQDPQQQLSQLYPQIYQEMSEMLVANILLTKAAEKSSLVVSEETLSEEIANIEANIPEGKTLQEMLTENEIDLGEWKENLRKQLLIGKLVEKKTATVEDATTVEAAEFYEENIESFKTPEGVQSLADVKDELLDYLTAQKKQEVLIAYIGELKEKYQIITHRPGSNVATKQQKLKASETTTSEASSASIETVKSGTLTFDTSVTVGGALTGYKYFKTTEWKQFSTSQGREIVQCTGKMDLDAFLNTLQDSGYGFGITPERVIRIKECLLEATYTIQFSISKVDDSFLITSSSLKYKFNKQLFADSNNEYELTDEQLTALNAIYNNEPEPTTLEMLWTYDWDYNQ